MIEPKKIEIEGKNFIISKFPAMAGREIIAKYITSGMPKVGDYAANEEVMLKMLKFAVAINNGIEYPLECQAIIDAQVPSWEILLKLEGLILEYNCSFFQNGRISRFLEDIAQKLPEWISKMLTALSAQSLPKEKQL